MWRHWLKQLRDCDITSSFLSFCWSLVTCWRRKDLCVNGSIGVTNLGKRNAFRLRLTGSTAQPMSDKLDWFINLSWWSSLACCFFVAWFDMWHHRLEQLRDCNRSVIEKSVLGPGLFFEHLASNIVSSTPLLLPVEGSRCITIKLPKSSLRENQKLKFRTALAKF